MLHSSLLTLVVYLMRPLADHLEETERLLWAQLLGCGRRLQWDLRVVLGGILLLVGVLPL